MKLSRGQRDGANSFLVPPLPWCYDLSLETCAKWSTDCPPDVAAKVSVVASSPLIRLLSTFMGLGG